MRQLETEHGPQLDRIHCLSCPLAAKPHYLVGLFPSLRECRLTLQGTQMSSTSSLSTKHLDLSCNWRGRSGVSKWNQTSAQPTQGLIQLFSYLKPQLDGAAGANAQGQVHASFLKTQ